MGPSLPDDVNSLWQALSASFKFIYLPSYLWVQGAEAALRAIAVRMGPSLPHDVSSLWRAISGPFRAVGGASMEVESAPVPPEPQTLIETLQVGAHGILQGVDSWNLTKAALSGDIG